MHLIPVDKNDKHAEHHHVVEEPKHVQKGEAEKTDKLNHADSLIFQTEKQLTEIADKIPADKKDLSKLL
jgi:molecular chaperone DnaK (HSP70)